MRDAFLEFKSSPSSDALIALLRAHQERIFRLCYQVLHNAADAEDAAQGALLKIADGARRFDEPESFQRWLYRVSLNAALEAARKAARRRSHEARAAMQSSLPTPPDPAARLALFEAMAGLDDTSRAFLLRHHLEGEPLQSIAERAGYSVSGVSRRMERAREKLRRRLGGAAFAGLDWLSAPTPVPPDLVSGPVLAKVAIIAGGSIMVSKIATGLAVIIALVCLVGGGLLGAVLQSRSGRAREAELERRLASVHSPAPPPVSASPIRPSEPAVADPEKPQAVPPQPQDDGSLRGRLRRYKAFMEAWAKEKTTLGSRVWLDQKFAIEYRDRKHRELDQELEGIRDLIFGDPEAFLDFLRAPENEGCIGDLAIFAFGFRVNQHGMQFVRHLDFDTFPKSLTDGLLDLLRSGSVAQKEAAMNFFGNVNGHPEAFAESWTALLQDPDPKTQVRAVRLAGEIRAMSKDTFSAFLEAGRRSTHVEVRMEVATAMNWVEFPEAQDYLLERLEHATEPPEVAHVALALGNKFLPASKGGSAVDEEKLSRAVTTALTRGLEDGYVKYVARTILFLPPLKARPLLERAQSVASGAELRDALAAVIKKLDAGETRRESLEKVLWASK